MNARFITAVAIFVSTIVKVYAVDKNFAKCDVDAVVQAAFLKVHDGWSSDEVLLQDGLQNAFLSECKKKCPEVAAAEFNTTMLNRRKASKLNGKVSKRRSDRHTEYHHVAEIAARLMADKHHVNVDRVMCDPKMRATFDATTKDLLPSVDPYLLRKAAFGLRKARRLKPEFVVRIAEWGRSIHVHSVEELRSLPKLVPTGPGVYIFRDATGYLYVGESDNLRSRLAKHVNKSDRQSLAAYLSKNTRSKISVEIHAFDPKSNARKTRMRRAYESEIIASRKPRFNVRP